MSSINSTRSERTAWIVAAAWLAVSVVAGAQSAYVPERVFDAKRNQFTDFELMLADLARADVVLVGEEHNNPNTHKLEVAVLEGLARRRGELVVSLEMFERDVQESLAHFLMGHSDEADFLKEARAWPRYATDYKPIVDLAIAKKWPVIAANAPRAIATEVSTSGLDALQSHPEAEKAWFAREIRCPVNDDYFDRFAEAMGEHPADPKAGKTTEAAAARSRTERYYFAQCLKDETMAESVAQSYAGGAAGGKRPIVVHFTGSFHVEYGQGTTARIRRRLPDKRIAVVSVLPQKDLDRLAPDGKDRKRADYLVYTIGK